MRRLMITISYDGTKYCGWQIQPNGLTIEEVINKAASKICGEKIIVIGASRTDAGVHAKGQKAVFDTNSNIKTEKFSIAFNSVLPPDIVVTDCVEVDSNFHPRYADILKTYSYRIWINPIPDPVMRNYTYYHAYPLDIEKMRLGSSYLVGEHDFASFCSSKSDVKNTVRIIYNIDIEKNQDEIIITFTGNGFLYNMIRMIVGVLIKIGNGYYEPEYIKELLIRQERGLARPTAPALGLCLESIEYI